MPEQAFSVRVQQIKERERKSESPIEAMVHDCLKRLKIPFLQQEPVGPFFADFYLPEMKVVLECDGKQFHDGVRDGQRDQYMRERGYRIYRLQGSEIYHSPMRAVLRVLGDIEGDSPYSSLIPRIGYGKKKFCEGDKNCAECQYIRSMEGKNNSDEIYDERSEEYED